MSCEEFIKQWEGCRLTAYSDQGGKVTIGYGHTGNIQLGTTWTMGEAEEALQKDIKTAQDAITALVRPKLTDNQLTALTSFVFNLGAHNLERSGLLKAINREEWQKAGDQLLLWCYVGLYKSPGLLARRTAERELFLTPMNPIQ